MRHILGICVLAAMTVAARGAEFRVGPGLDYDTVQEAIQVATVVTPGVHEIMVVAGTQMENIEIHISPGIKVNLSGGWASDFSRRDGVTVIDSNGWAPVVSISGNGGQLKMNGFKVTGSNSSKDTGGGIRVNLRGFAQVVLRDNAISGNRLSRAGRIAGVGLWARLEAISRLVLRDNVFKRNAAIGSESRVSGVGAHISAFNGSVVRILGNEFAGNQVKESFSAGHNGVALSVLALQRAHIEVTENEIHHNKAGQDTYPASTLRLQSGIWETDGGSVEARRNNVIDNTLNTTSPHAAQVAATAVGSGRLIVSDSVIARSNRGAVLASARAGAQLHLTNLTITDHDELGLIVSPWSTGDVYLSNSIVFNNNIDTSGPFVSTTNLVGVDPHFADAGLGDYRLDLGAPGIDAGMNLAPGGLGPFDLDNNDRIRGLSVDIGAYEKKFRIPEFACSALWEVPPVSRYTNACRCASDSTIKGMRCALFGPEMFGILRIPLRPEFPGGPVPAEWTLYPWMPVAGSYSMKMETFVDKQWQPGVWIGPSAEGLEDGQITTESFEVKLSDTEATPVRTRIEFERGGDKTPAYGVLEVQVPAAYDRQ